MRVTFIFFGFSLFISYLISSYHNPYHFLLSLIMNYRLFGYFIASLVISSFVQCHSVHWRELFFHFEACCDPLRMAKSWLQTINRNRKLKIMQYFPVRIRIGFLVANLFVGQLLHGRLFILEAVPSSSGQKHKMISNIWELFEMNYVWFFFQKSFISKFGRVI